MTKRALFALATASLSIGIAAAQPGGSPPSAPLVDRPRLESAAESMVLSFSEDVSLAEAFHEVSEQAGVTILFDEAFRDQTTRLNLGRVSVGDALTKLTTIHRLFYKILDSRTVIIVPDNAQKHRQYDEMLLHSFYVEHNDVNTVANMFRTLAAIQRIQADPVQKSVTVRATADQLLVAHSILERNDAPPAEVDLWVEILAVAVDSDAGQIAGAALTSEAFAGFKSDRAAELLLLRTIRLTDNEPAFMSVEEVGEMPVAPPGAETDDAHAPTEETSAESPRAVGLRLRFRPQLSRAGDVKLAFTLRATAHAGHEATSSPLCARDVTSSISMRPGEVTLVPVTFRVGDFGVALQRVGAREDSREVVVAIGVAVQPTKELPVALPPLPMGTEQQVQVPLM